MRMPHNTIHRVCPSCSARSSAHTAAMSRNTSSASGLLKRNINVATGVSASTAPAIKPAGGPKCFRTIRYSSATEATPNKT